MASWTHYFQIALYTLLSVPSTKTTSASVNLKDCLIRSSIKVSPGYFTPINIVKLGRWLSVRDANNFICVTPAVIAVEAL